MPNLDDEIREGLRNLAEPVGVDGVLDRVRARKDRVRFARRARAAAVVVTVVVSTLAGGLVVTRAFLPGHEGASGASIRLEGVGPIYFLRGESLIRGPGSGPTAIYRMAPDGSGAEQVIGGLASVSSLAWSPDGTRLIYTQSGGEFSQSNMYVMNAAGSAVERITHFSDPYGQSVTPAWSPDGRLVAFSYGNAGGGGDYEIFTVRPDGSGLTQLTRCTGRGCDASLGAVSPSWSPDGERIVFSRDHDLWIIEADGSGAHQVTQYDRELSLIRNGHAVSPTWSPDGSEIVFVLDQDPTYSLWEVHPDGSGLHKLYACSGPECLGILAPSWSPDGAQIAFTLIGSEPGVPRHVAVVDADGSNLRILTEAPPDACCPSWRPVPPDSVPDQTPA